MSGFVQCSVVIGLKKSRIETGFVSGISVYWQGDIYYVRLINMQAALVMKNKEIMQDKDD